LVEEVVVALVMVLDGVAAVDHQLSRRQNGFHSAPEAFRLFTKKMA
jgi:hypothetical protein